MTSEVMLYVGSGVVALWGISHFFPTGSVVRGFGDISRDNKRIITMEWIAEGLALCYIGFLVTAVTIVAGADNPVAILVYRVSAAMLVAMAGLSLLTGARTSILPMKFCPVIFTTAAILFVLASFL